MEAKQTPLIDLLERVPLDAVLVVEHDQFSSSSHPVGRLCHEAAAALRAVLAEAEKLRAEVERLNRILGRIVEGDGDSTTTIRAGTDAFAAAREYLRRNRAALAAYRNEALLRQALEALEVGRDYAFETAERFHIEMRGYKQQRHDAMDADVKQIDSAIAALKQRLGETK